MELIFGSFDGPISVCNNQSNKFAPLCNNYRLSEIDDAVYEILMRIDPCNLFKCVLVSKDWLSVIASPSFRKRYLNKWKDSTSIVVGMLSFDMMNSWRPYFPGKPRAYTVTQPGLELLATSNVGRNMINWNFKPRGLVGSKSLKGGQNVIIGNSMPSVFFVSKSPKGGLLLSCGIQPDTFYVCKSNFGGPLVELPRPLMHYKSCMANILSDDDDSKYRVILACAFDTHKDGKLRIQTYCSWTGRWEPSTLSCPSSLFLRPLQMIESGIVTYGGTGGGVIYWKANKNYRQDCFAVWDINGGSISEIPRPPRPVDKEDSKYFYFSTTYGVAPQPQGSLLAATCCHMEVGMRNLWELKGFIITIWALSDDDKKGWYLSHSVRHASIWANNLALLNSLFEARPLNEGFTFVSFFPGKSDSIFVGLKQRLFVYHFQTGKLEYVDILKHGLGFKRFMSLVVNHPLTMLDTGIWPSSPLSLQLPCCS